MTDTISPIPFPRPSLWSLEASFLVIVVSLIVWKWRLFSRRQPRDEDRHVSKPHRQRGTVNLQQVYPVDPSTAADVDIIAIHGLDTNSHSTWVWKDREKRRPDVNWLSDAGMLPEKVGRARIFLCDWPADMFESYSHNSIEEFARLLLDGINRRAPPANGHKMEGQPLIFVASCLGGIVLSKALTMASNEFKSIQTATRGIVFLATPFRGTSFEDVAAWAEPGLRAWAATSNSHITPLLHYTKASFDLIELVTGFTQLCLQCNYRVFTFYELGMTNIYKKAVPSIKRGSKLLVDKNSATLDIVAHPMPLHRNHVMTNKFEGPQDSDYSVVSEKIAEIIAETRKKGSDEWIRCNHYTKERLRIERLSGDLLPMEQCFINLVIIPRSMPESIQETYGWIEFPNMVELATIFTGSSDTPRPRRILIRGRAGVGKSTLCKKIVYDFVWNTESELHQNWSKLFDRILWIPLRNLQGLVTAGYNHEELFYHEFFCAEGLGSGRHLARELWSVVKNTMDTNNDRTLFVLDGLDEIASHFHRTGMAEFLTRLLNHQNVIVTSRPNASIPTLNPFDLELETVGFSRGQMHSYIKADPKMKDRLSDVLRFLGRHPKIEGLFQIPIQLDALCLTWENISISNAPVMTTSIYQTIERTLWRKDAIRLAKKYNGTVLLPSDIEVCDAEDLVTDEINLLERVAFSGFMDNIFNFDLNQISLHKPPGMLLAKTLPYLSFIRPSNPTLEIPQQVYHFMHLSFQEYFAARYFARKFLAGQPLEHFASDQKATYTEPFSLICKHKYTPRFENFWRFAAGIMGSNHSGDDLTAFLDAIQQPPRDAPKNKHQLLLLQYLEESTGKHACPQNAEDDIIHWLWNLAEAKENVDFMNIDVSAQILIRALKEGSENFQTIFLRRSPPFGNLHFFNTPMELIQWLTENLWESNKVLVSLFICSHANAPGLPGSAIEILTAKILKRKPTDYSLLETHLDL